MRVCGLCKVTERIILIRCARHSDQKRFARLPKTATRTSESGRRQRAPRKHDQVCSNSKWEGHLAVTLIIPKVLVIQRLIMLTQD